MATTLRNPYCTVEEVKRELKFEVTDVSRDDDIKLAINNATAWIDEYTGRDYRFHDHSIEGLEFDENSDIDGNHLFLPNMPVIGITSVTLGGVTLIDGTDYKLIRVRNGENYLSSLNGDWDLSQPDNTLLVYGTFGYRQTSYWTVTEAGDTANQLSSWTLNNLDSDAVLYWRLAEESLTECKLEIFLEEEHTNLIASGVGLKNSTITLEEQNASGVTGSVTVAYTADDDDDANTLTPIEPSTDTTEVPQDIPPFIRFAAAQVAAVLSGHDRKEVVGLDGQKTVILNNQIPKTVYDTLGTRRKNSVMI